MNIDTINKIKSGINPKCCEFFTRDEIVKYKFIPVNKQAGFLYVVVSDASNKASISDFISLKVPLNNLFQKLCLILLDLGP